jgi:WD40 repeat protein
VGPDGSLALADDKLVVRGVELPLKDKATATAFAFGSNGAVAYGDDAGRVHLQLAGGAPRELPGGADGPVSALAFGGELVAAGYSDGGVRLWRASDGAPQRRLEAYGEEIAALAFRGETLTTLGQSGVVRVFDARRGQKLRVIDDLEVASPITGSLSADGRYVAMLIGDPEQRRVRVLDTERGARVATFPAERTDARPVFFGGAVAVIDDGAVRLWSLGLRIPIASLHAMVGEEGGYVLSADGYADPHGSGAGALLCRFGPRSYPFDLCEERVRSQGLLRQLLRNEHGYRRP